MSYQKNHRYRRLVDVEPGKYFALDRIYYPQSGRFEVEKLPIISWEITQKADGTTEVKPIASSRFSALYQGEVLHPDGYVRSDLYDRETYDQFLKRAALEIEVMRNGS
jgi:hypothetical protein